MWIVDLDKKVVHDMSKPAYECQISKIDKERRKKIYTKGGVDRFLDDPLNTREGYRGCQFCMPEYFEFNMQSIFQSND
ncbi:hypothetical protein KQI52_10980 [bacterium]|nr:hypothetical protein [bacterium]